VQESSDAQVALAKSKAETAAAQAAEAAHSAQIVQLTQAAQAAHSAQIVQLTQAAHAAHSAQIVQLTQAAQAAQVRPVERVCCSQPAVVRVVRTMSIVCCLLYLTRHSAYLTAAAAAAVR